MIFIIGFVVIVTLTVVAIIRSKKPLKLILVEAKYEIIYNLMGSKAILEDVWMKTRNKTGRVPPFKLIYETAPFLLDLPKLTGKVALITGGSRGIGLEVVKMLLKCDVFVIIGCRNVAAGELLLDKFRKDSIDSGNIAVYQLDISSIKSVKKFANIVALKHPKIHFLINNAGIMFGPYVETKDGFESQLSTNYLGHFLLTHLLLPEIKAAGTKDEKARIVNVSSCAHMVGDINFNDINFRNQYIPSEAYAQSKLAQVLFTNYLDKLFAKEDIPVQIHSVHPGIVNTELFDGTHLKNLAPWVPNLMFKTPEQGAIPIVYACVSSNLEGKGGTYIHNCQVYSTSKNSKSIELQEKLFNFTKDLLKIENFGN